MSDDREIFQAAQRRPATGKALVVRGARQNNLKNIDVEIPLGQFVCVTGASGSGKSSLIHEIVHKRLVSLLHDSRVLAGAHNSLTVLQMSTISPALTEKLARDVAARHLGFLDCPVSGTSSMVERGDGIFFVRGERGLYERWRPMLESVLPRAVLVGGVGQAMTLKLVANLLVALHSAAAAEALTLARKAGLDLDIALDVRNSSAATSSMLKVRGPMIVRGDFPAQMKLDLFMKDIHLMQEAAAAVGAPLPFTDLAEGLYGAAQAAGHGGEDLAVVVTALGRSSARRPRPRHAKAGSRRGGKSVVKKSRRRPPAK